MLKWLIKFVHIYPFLYYVNIFSSTFDIFTRLVTDTYIASYGNIYCSSDVEKILCNPYSGDFCGFFFCSFKLIWIPVIKFPLLK